MNEKNTGRFGRSPNAGGTGRGPLTRSEHLARITAVLQRSPLSLRELERETGVPKSTLHAIVHERPGAGIEALPRLIPWYEEELRRQEGKLEDPADIAILLNRMFADLPASRRRRVLRRMLDAAAAACDEQRTPRPPWIDALRAALEAEERGEG